MSAQETFSEQFPSLVKLGLVQFPDPNAFHPDPATIKHNIARAVKAGKTTSRFYSPQMAERLSTRPKK